jgi:3-dehydroquinate dehydratase I
VKHKPKICASITGNDRQAIETAAPDVDLFEARIDLIGAEWRETVSRLQKPWIACNRRADDGGKWHGSEEERIARLEEAVRLGAAIVDIELGADDLEAAVKSFQQAGARVLVSFHSQIGTPPLETLRDIVAGEFAAGADIGKVAVTANRDADNITALRLLRENRGRKLVAFAMGEAGSISRILCPLAGGEFTYAAVAAGAGSAPGQLTVAEMKEIYEML